MLSSALVAAAFCALAIPLLPSARVQRSTLTWSRRLLRLVLLGTLMLGAFVSLNPQPAAELVSEVAEALPVRFDSPLTGVDLRIRWLVGSALIVLLAVPLLALMDFARSRAAETALLQRLLGELSESGRIIAHHLEEQAPDEPRLSPQRRREMRSALHAIQGVTEQAAASAPQRRTLAEYVQ